MKLHLPTLLAIITLTTCLTVPTVEARGDDKQQQMATSIPPEYQHLLRNIDTIIHSINITVMQNASLSIGSVSFVATDNQQSHHVEPFLQYIHQGNLTVNASAQSQYLDFVRNTMVQQLETIKMSLLDTLIQETSEFLTFFNQSTSVLEQCDWQCFDNCTAQNQTGLLIEARVGCLDKCGCYRSAALNSGEELEDLPISNRTLEKVASKLNTNRNLTQSDIQLQLEIAKELYFAEIEFERETKKLDAQIDIIGQIATVFPEEYVVHLKKQVQAERAQLVRERVAHRLETTVESLGEKAHNSTLLIEQLMNDTAVTLECNQTCIQQCNARARNLEDKFSCMEDCRCFDEPLPAPIALETTQLFVSEVMILCSKANDVKVPFVACVAFVGLIYVVARMGGLIVKRKGKKETDFVRLEDEPSYKAIQ